MQTPDLAILIQATLVEEKDDEALINQEGERLAQLES